MKYSIPASLVLAAACTSSDEQLLMQAGIPDDVMARVPDGVSKQAVGLEGGCYIYDDADGGVVFVTDASGWRICVN